MADTSLKPDIRLQHFEGPLDLLCHLIEKNDIDICDIPIADITSQYMDYLSQMQKLDMEIASDFLVMGATLVHIKSRMMLPGKRAGEAGSDDEIDPREELVISLMRYKRCRVFASELKERRARFEGARMRPQTPAKELGIDTVFVSNDFSHEAFDEAISDINARNEMRFTDISAKIKHILRKDKLSIKQRMKQLWLTITKKGKILFSELFAGKKPEKIDKIVSFLAILELVRNNEITVEQKSTFSDMLIEERKN